MEQKIIQAIETEYNGYRFRSRLEARWAVFFDAIGADYKYEPEGYRLEDGSRYLPDFYLTNVSGRGTRNIFIEIKGVVSDIDLHKIELFSRHYPVIIFGDIPKYNSAYGDMDYNCTDEVFNLEFSEGDYYWTYPKASVHNGLVLDYPDNPYSYVDEKLTQKAYEIARQARFEHGETPTADQVYKMARC